MNLADQIKALVATRTEKVAQMNGVAEKAAKEGRSMDQAEQEQFDELDGEVKTIDSDLVRLKRLEQLSAQTAQPVESVTTVKTGAAAREIKGAPAIVVSRNADEHFKGQSYTRMVIAKALAWMNQTNPVYEAQKRWGKSNPLLVEVIKAGVAGGGTDSGEWGAELAEADSRFTGDFIEYLYAATVYDKLPFRTIPANVTVKGQDGTATGYWVGQSKAIPVSAQDYMDVTLTELQVGAIAVVSNRLLRDASPDAEMLVRDSLVNASSQRVDQTVFSTNAASAGVSPAGLLNGVTAIGSAGSDGDAVREDIRELYQPFLNAFNASDLAFVTNKSLAKALQLMRNALGQREFEGVTQNGGTLEGDSLFTGDNIGAGHLILLKPSDIYKIGDRGVEVSVSREATIEQDSAPQGASDTPVAASATLQSMFQTESTAIKVVRSINFAKRRSHAVQYVNDAAYATVASP